MQSSNSLDSLDSLGWSPFFQKQFDDLITDDPRASELVLARVLIEYQDRYQLIGRDGPFMAQLSGILLKEAMDDRLRRPAVGDWLAVRPGQGEDDNGTIVHLFDRRTQFVRQLAGRRTGAQVVAANVDAVFVVTSFNRDFNPRRIERYLTTVWDSGARAVIVINKLDLCDDPAPYLDELEAVAPGVPVISVSAVDHRGLDDLRREIRDGETVALVGSSGVGKSTLINWMIGSEIQEVGDIREGDSKGRHTTTHRELIVLRDDDGEMPNAILIDTPGMRELQMWSAGDGVSDTFADIAELAEKCRFRDCQHESEPGCAIQAAAKAGEIEKARLVSYFKLRQEVAHAEKRQSESAALAERRKWKRIAKLNRTRKRFTGR